MLASEPNIDYQAIFIFTPNPYLILDKQFNIVEVNPAYLNATMVNRFDILGRNVFDVFPDNPNDLKATGTKNLRASLERVLKNQISDAMALQKYDIQRPQTHGGGFEERYWSPINVPIFGKDHQVEYILHHVEDVTALVRLKKAGLESTALHTE
jgi:PAS domain-containing protein